jgi:thiol-disulfide isomerase/thioredoxin
MTGNHSQQQPGPRYEIRWGLLTLVSVFLVCFASAANGKDGDTLLEKYVKIEDLDLASPTGFQYLMGMWPIFCHPCLDTAYADIATRISSEYVKNGRFSTKSLRVYQRFESRFFRSSYYLAYIISDLTMLGAMAPTCVFFARNPSSGEFFPLTSFADSSFRRRDWLNSLGRASWYLTNDFVPSTLDSLSAIEAARDAVSLISPAHPIIFLNSIYDVYEYSNTLGGELIWSELGSRYTADTVLSLLSSFRLLDISRNEYLTGNYSVAVFDSVAFLSMRDWVKSPIALKDSSGFWVTSLCTWSPDTGILMRWKVSLDEKGRLQTFYETWPEDWIGWYFSYM